MWIGFNLIVIKQTNRVEANLVQGIVRKPLMKYEKIAYKAIEIMHRNTPEQKWLRRIIECESGGDPSKVNPTPIVHCKVGSDYKAYPNSCIEGVEVHREHASGLTQILPSSFKRWGCEGDIFNYDDNVHCALQAYRNGYAGEWECL